MIIAARVSKPTIPQQLQGDFVRVEEEISKLKVLARNWSIAVFSLLALRFEYFTQNFGHSSYAVTYQ